MTVPILHYKFNESEGEVVFKDERYLDLYGSLNSSAFIESGKIGNALYFTTSQGIEIPAASTTNSVLNSIGKENTSYTVCLWINSSKAAYPTKRIMEKLSSVSPIIIREITGNGAIFFSLYDGTNFSSCLETNAMQPNTWHHYCWIINRGKNIILYRNGTLNRIVSDITLGNLNNNATFVFGNDSSLTKSFVGGIDDFRIYGEALSLEEIRFIYNDGKGREDYLKNGRGTPFGGILMQRRRRNMQL